MIAVRAAGGASRGPRALRHAFACLVAASCCATPIGARAGPDDGRREDPISLLLELAGFEERDRPAGFVLSAEERKAQDILREIVAREIATYRRTKSFPPAGAFAVGKEAIEQSQSFGILRKMPKGGALHVHSSAAGRARWIVYNACYRPDCYVYWPGDPSGSRDGFVKGELGFFRPGGAPAGFRPVDQVRRAVPGFDRQLLELITLGPEDDEFPDVWEEFARCFQRIGKVVSYQPVFLDYFADAFETLVADGVDYVELRTGLGTLYDLDGRRWEGERFIAQYLAVRDRVRARHPDFDLKLIITGSRFDPVEEVREDIWRAFPLRAKWPGFVLGYDLVGEEDAGNKMEVYFCLLLEVSLLRWYYGVNMPLYLHDGETLWRDESNIRGAYLLNARRVGHGLNLFYFPALERNFIRRRVPLEICPVSNQALRFVGDLRLHPANGYLRKGVTCVLSSDDPGIFGNDGLSYDFWEALLAWELELIDLKRLCLNSIDFSAMTPAEKRLARRRWEAKWAAFIRDLNRVPVGPR
jgi:adenosine deaminase CECR1